VEKREIGNSEAWEKHSQTQMMTTIQTVSKT
jgi:hypothetical protein